jgi:MFS family permease
VLGGVLLEANLFELGWRTIFLVNVPVGALAIIAAREVLPAGVRGAGRLDLVGAAGISAGLGLALAPLVLGQGYYLLLVAVPALAAALAWERRAKQPLLPLTLFRERAFSVGLLVNVAFMVSFGGLMFVLTLLLQTNLGLRPLAAGLTFLPLALASMATSLIGPRLVARFGLAVLAAGAMTELLGLVSLAIELHGADLAVAWMLAPLTVIGAGSGLVLPALIGLVLQGVPPKQAGAAAGVLTTSQQFAAATGVAALGAVYFAKGNAELVAWLDAGLIATMAALTALLREQSLKLRDKLGSRHRQSEVPHAAESQV